MSKSHSPIMIFAGGTGGHVFPALAVANQISQQSVPVVWVGTKKGIEAKVVAEAGYPIEWISVTGIRGKHFLTLIFAPFKITLAGLQVIWLLLKHRPCAVLGMGGFVSGPGGMIAAMLHKPLIIHEQNAIAGLTNRILAPFAKRILTGFPNTFVRNNVEVVGNPVRTEITQINREFEIAEPEHRSLRLLIFGGSLGARALNETVPSAINLLPEELRPEVWHQTGKHSKEFTQQQYREYSISARVDKFIDEMHIAYAWADIVICRAGAITTAELAVAGVGAIFVPYPYAVDDHQTANALAFVNANAAHMISESEFSDKKLAELMHELFSNPVRLKSIAKNIADFAKPDAAKNVAAVCLNACDGNSNREVKFINDYSQ